MAKITSTRMIELNKLATKVWKTIAMSVKLGAVARLLSQ